MIRRHYSNDRRPLGAWRRDHQALAGRWARETRAVQNRLPAQRPDPSRRCATWPASRLGLETSVVDLDEITAFEPLLSLEGYRCLGARRRIRRQVPDDARLVCGRRSAGVRPALGRTRSSDPRQPRSGIRRRHGRWAHSRWNRFLPREAGGVSSHRPILELPISLRRLEVAFVRQPADPAAGAGHVLRHGFNVA